MSFDVSFDVSLCICSYKKKKRTFDLAAVVVGRVAVVVAVQAGLD